MITPQLADSFVDSAAAYVHIPFCSSICPYCDFAVVAGQDDLAERYVDAVVAEINMSDSWRPLDAIYFGGGTPSHIDPVLLARVLESLVALHGISGDAEISLEANPEDFTQDRADLLKAIGFNRVSFGAQSFDAGVLMALGRRHQADHVTASVHAARDSGFENISLDLIYGEPGESDESWIDTIEKALALQPDHLSCYALTVEPGTPLGKAVGDGATAPDPDEQAQRYEVLEEMLSLGRYEVSNWSSTGYQCRYNMTVWAQGQYEAYGNGAHGYRDGIRFRNIRHLNTYLETTERGQIPRAGEETITGWDKELDRLFVGLRRTVGVAVGDGTKSLLDSEDGIRLLDAGVIESNKSRLRVIRPLFTDAVHRAVLALQAPIVSGKSDA